MRSDTFSVGEVPVFKITGKDIPIVHRIIEAHPRKDGDFDLLTKVNVVCVLRPRGGRRWLVLLEECGFVAAYVCCFHSICA